MTMAHLITFEQLKEILAELHDCPIDLDEAQFDRAQREWRGFFLRPVCESPSAVHRYWGFIAGESRCPVAEGKLVIRGVAEVRRFDDQGIGTYTLNRVQSVPGGLHISFNELLRLEIVLDGPIDATYEERLLPGHTAVYRMVLGAETGPKIVIDPAAPSRLTSG